jgi:hypothetical protein
MIPKFILSVKGRMESIESLPDRFSKYVSQVPDENGCLLWKGTKSVAGYGFLGISEKNYRAHRLAFYLANGYFPPEGDVVGHKCDVKLCCNPEHLEHITHKENMRQMKERGRAFKGAKPRLTLEQKIAISTSHLSIGELTRQYNVHPRTIERVRADFSN